MRATREYWGWRCHRAVLESRAQPDPAPHHYNPRNPFQGSRALCTCTTTSLFGSHGSAARTAVQNRSPHSAPPPPPQPRRSRCRGSRAGPGLRSIPPVTCLEGLEGDLPADAGPGRGPAGALRAAGAAHYEPIHVRPAVFPHGSRQRGPAISAR